MMRNKSFYGEQTKRNDPETPIVLDSLPMITIIIEYIQHFELKQYILFVQQLVQLIVADKSCDTDPVIQIT